MPPQWVAGSLSKRAAVPGVLRSRPRLTLLLFFSLSCLAHAEVQRLVLLKADGVPFEALDRFVREQHPETGKSLLPWIDHVFYEGGSRLSNFYVRGISLSAPSWSLLDTGQHLQIKGNIEFDRFTLRTYDYLNFLTFFFSYSAGRQLDMPGTELLDQLGVPLLLDAFPTMERHLIFQLLQRGSSLTTLQKGLRRFLFGRTPRDWLDEWAMGFAKHSIVFDQLERELLESLNEPQIRYLDYYTPRFDHVSHLNRDSESQLSALREIDRLVGKVWTAIGKTPQAASTVLVLVSDHGTNSDDTIYSQGFNLIELLASGRGGAHHVISKRPLLADYTLKSLSPTVPLVTTTSPDSAYLKGQSSGYPTALIDLDGNERASVYLRNSDLNLLHILWQQLLRRDLDASRRAAAVKAFFATIERQRTSWQAFALELGQELAALGQMVNQETPHYDPKLKKWSAQEKASGQDKDSLRQWLLLRDWRAQELEYRQALKSIERLLKLTPETFDPEKLRIQDYIAPKAMGLPNSIHQLQNYVVRLQPGELILAPNGDLEVERTFERLDYFSLMERLAVRNNVQAGVDSQPIDFVAARLPFASLSAEAKADLGTTADPIWLYAGQERQALVLSLPAEGSIQLKYLPIQNLQQNERGEIRFETGSWRDGLPLRIWEDPQLQLAVGQDKTWLKQWHTDVEWLRVLHRTRYSNGLIGLHEQFAEHLGPKMESSRPGLSTDEALIARFRRRQRQLLEPDFVVFARDHWNFNAFSFNPGGNHGSFFRISTQSILMFAGGQQTGIHKGLVIEEPYDSLSLVPTLLTLTGQIKDGRVSEPLQQKGFWTFPGRIISELLGDGP